MISTTCRDKTLSSSPSHKTPRAELTPLKDVLVHLGHRDRIRDHRRSRRHKLLAKHHQPRRLDHVGNKHHLHFLPASSGPQDHTLTPAETTSIMLVVIVTLNFMPVRAYAESEFWFASIKVFTIIGLLVLSVVLFFGGGPSHEPLYFKFWADPGATKEYLADGAAGRFCALLYGMIYSAFSFNFGPELMVLTSGEMEAPRRNLPRAATRFIWRLLIFYALGALAIGVICPSDDARLTQGGSGAAASPWVVAISNAGIRGLDSVINAVIITSAWSSGNSVLYMSSRSLYSMAVAGSAPAVFRRCSAGGVPYLAVLASAGFAPLAYLSVGSAGSATVFNWLVSLLNTTGFISWVLCCVIFFRFRAACASQGVRRKDLPYVSVLQPYGAWVAFFAFSLFGLCNGFSVFFPGSFSASSFFTAYIGIPVFLVIYVGHKILKGRSEPWCRPAQAVDLRSGLVEVLAAEEAYESEQAERRSRKPEIVPVWQRPFRAIFSALFE